MKTLHRAAAAGARKAWLWRNRSDFGHAAFPEQPRLLVDVSTIIRHDAQTGIQRVVRAVLAELERRNGNGFVLQPVFATATHGYCCAPRDFLQRKSFPSDATDPVRAGKGDKFVGLDLSLQILPHYRQQLNAWRAQGATTHLIVYDLLPLLRPEWFSAATASNFRKWYNVLVSDTDQAICISDEVAHALRERLTAGPRSRPAVMRMKIGADIAASMPSIGVSREVSAVLDRLRFRPAILMVGTVEPRKGYDVALAAFERLWRTDPADAPDLVIVGKPGWKTSDLQAMLRSHPQRGVRLHWLTDASDQALCRLYGACTAVLVASRGEGFGLPLVEAAMYRRHMLARDLAVFREQRLANVSYFQDDSPSALGRELIELVARGKGGPAPSAKLPSWSDCVANLLREIGIEHAECTRTELPLRKAS
jgi:glycosyltransferase involved in cell wall biosynthesis